MKRLFGKNGSLNEPTKTSDFEPVSRGSVTPLEPPLTRIQSTPVPNLEPETLSNEVNIDALLMDSRFHRNSGTHSGFELITSSKVEKGFEEIYEEMVSRGEILEINHIQSSQSALHSRSNYPQPLQADLEQSQTYSTKENRTGSMMFESCFFTPAARIATEEVVHQPDVKPEKSGVPDPEQKNTITLDAKLLTSLMHTRFRALQSVLASSPDALFPLDPSPSSPPSLTARDVFEKFGETETEDIKRVLRQELIGRTSVNKEKVFLSNLGDVQAVREAAGQTRLSMITNDVAISPQSKKRYISENPQLFLLETSLMDELNNIIGPERYAAIRCVAMSPHPHRLLLVGFENGDVFECTTAPKKTVKKHAVGDNVSALALSPAGEYFAAGALNSEILVKKIDSMGKKTIQNLDGNQILQIQFLSESVILVSTQQGVYTLTIKNFMMIKMEVYPTLIIPMPGTGKDAPPLTSCRILIGPDCVHLAASFADRVQVYRGEFSANKDSLSLTRLQGEVLNLWEPHANKIHPNNRWPPISDWILPKSKITGTYLIVFWKNTIGLYKVHGDELQNRTIVNIDGKAIWGKILDNRIITYLTPSLQIEFLSVDRVFSTASTTENLYARIPLDRRIMKSQNEESFVQEMTSKLEDTGEELRRKLKYFKFFSTRVNTVGADIIMITDIGLIKHQLISFLGMVHKQISIQDFSQAIKLCNNVFLERVNPSDMEKEGIRQLVPQIVARFAEKAFGGQLITLDDQINVLDIVIEALICSAHEEYLYSTVRGTFDPKLFWNRVAGFVAEKKIKYIPAKYLVIGTDFLEANQVIELLQKIEIDGDETQIESTLNQILSIVKSKNLWVYYYRICIASPSHHTINLFLTMLLAELLNMDSPVRLGIAQETLWRQQLNIDLQFYFMERKRQIYFRPFWVLRLIVSPGALPRLVSLLGANSLNYAANIPTLCAYAVDWLFNKGNSLVLAEQSLQVLFETYGQLLLNSLIIKSEVVLDTIHRIREELIINAPKLLKEKDSDQRQSDMRVWKLIQSQLPTGNVGTGRKSPKEPFCSIPERVIDIIEALFEGKYKPEIGFLVLRSILFCPYENTFTNVRWICKHLKNLLQEPFLEGRYWLDYSPIPQDQIEDMLITILAKLQPSSEYKLHEDEFTHSLLSHN
jgi:hypothetical protein